MIRVTKTAIPKYLANGGKDYNHLEIQNALKDIYNHKCCYCEQSREDFEVEHYRPQKAPRSQNPEHNGYPWLKLEWSNLLWSCSTCNAGEGGKHNKFPVANQANRVTAESNNALDKAANSSYLLAEGALLLHPEIDNPEEHLTILPDGMLDHITIRGDATIKVCNLNRTEPNPKSILLQSRKNAIDSICTWIKNLVLKVFEIIEQGIGDNNTLFSFLELIFDAIRDNRANSAQFALLHRVFYENFDTFIDANTDIQASLAPDYINAIKQTFTTYKLKNP